VHLTPSCGSHLTRRLEEHLRKLLLQRNTRTVTLTHDGASFQAYAERVLNLIDEAVGPIQRPAQRGCKRCGLAREHAVDGEAAYGRADETLHNEIGCETVYTVRSERAHHFVLAIYFKLMLNRAEPLGELGIAA
jgi:ABC-type sulfate/molybdate transport systems ATPase subunit